MKKISPLMRKYTLKNVQKKKHEKQIHSEEFSFKKYQKFFQRNSRIV